MHKNTQNALKKVYGEKIPEQVEKEVTMLENVIAALGGGSAPTASIAQIVIKNPPENKKEPVSVNDAEEKITKKTTKKASRK